MAHIEITRLAETQFEAAAQLLTAAFLDDPLFTYMLPDRAERRRRLPTLFTADVRFAHLFGEAFVAGALDGLALWHPPGVDLTPERAAQVGYDQLKGAFGPEALQRFGQVLEHISSHHHQNLPAAHWYLAAVGVAPERQRQGIGRALLAPVLARIDAVGLPCCLDTSSPRNVPFYQRLGFTILHESIEPESGLRLWTFCREP